MSLEPGTTPGDARVQWPEREGKSEQEERRDHGERERPDGADPMGLTRWGGPDGAGRMGLTLWGWLNGLTRWCRLDGADLMGLTGWS